MIGAGISSSLGVSRFLTRRMISSDSTEAICWASSGERGRGVDAEQQRGLDHRRLDLVGELVAASTLMSSRSATRASTSGSLARLA